ncbi:baculoviral IAP repeat-containing protein 1-like [Hemiscyllium ocellatum]|uniref:baculoviral IAP repeat-containing protein 1-like n=1 Tax=Hemiscyllium ocellatum TaxID=170820 RepID=UPI002966447A|nr:baculoviral IAP repeat-containing protein 1-like [Hemiscyllium ocellatum]XP_060710575.1 baculoviral IAP repeat-containing protein 1-like [Hemiscyllium ocellatum]XP_060710576.1 baculoviral IAP repeat-containing protein 1-like [Hemiscyllium ocellatum]
MATQELAPPPEGATQGTATLHRQMNANELQSIMPLMNFNMAEFVAQIEEQDAAFCRQRVRGYNARMRSELRRLKSFESYPSFSSWSPEEMADAGFYYTGTKTYIQCFCCGGVLSSTSLTKTPWSEHRLFEPDCGLVKALDVGDVPKYAVRVQPPSKILQSQRQQLVEERSRLESFGSWPFYAPTEPALLAGAGFFYTGSKDQVQCFSCDGSLANWEEGDDPWQEHAKWFPQCEYLQGQKSEEERDQYSRSYIGFPGVMGAHFLSLPALDDLPPSPLTRSEDPVSRPDPDRGWNIFVAERTRLESFHTWPSWCSANPAELAEAGFFYEGLEDRIQCFCCGVHLHKWEEGDNPWTEHQRHSPQCPYLQARDKDGGDVGQAQIQESSPTMPDVENREKEDPFAGGIPSGEGDWAEAIRGMRRRLRELYLSSEFSTISFNGCVSVDLRRCYAEPCLALRDLAGREVRRLVLPELLRDLRRVTLLEGEAGMGKSALLRQVALLWASSRCPLLSRFALVLHVPGGAGRNAAPGGRCLGALASRLGERLLVLLDDSGSPPVEEEEELVRANHRCGGAAVLLALRTDRAAGARRFADAAVSVVGFPLYSCARLLKAMFAHDVPRLRRFVQDIGFSETLRGSMKSPLFALALCQHWVREPLDAGVSCVTLFRAFLDHAVSRRGVAEPARTTLASCGRLALTGFLACRRDFTDGDLQRAGVAAEPALALGLLSKFTAQRLSPVYRFPHPSFQEYLAGTRLGSLLGSEVAAEREEGSSALGRARTFLELFTRDRYLLVYAACQCGQAASRIAAHVLEMARRPSSFDCGADTRLALAQHPDLEPYRDLFVQCSRIMEPEQLQDVATGLLLDFVLLLTKAETRASIAPVLRSFLSGKCLTLSTSSHLRQSTFEFLKVYPEMLTVLGSLQVTVSGRRKAAATSYSEMAQALSHLGVPRVEEDYAAAFQSLEQEFLSNQEKEEQISGFSALACHSIPDPFVSALSSVTALHKAPALKLHVCSVDAFRPGDSERLLRLCSASGRVELTVRDAQGALGQMGDAVARRGESFRALCLHWTALSPREQELVTAMSSLEALELSFDDDRAPEYLLSRLDKLEHLKKLKIEVRTGSSLRIIDQISEGLATLRNMENLTLSGVNCVQDSSKLAHLLQNFSQLRVFHLNCTSSFPEFEDLSQALSSCSRLEELVLSALHLSPNETLAFTASLSKLQNLRVLEVPGINFSNAEEAEAFARAVGSLALLEVFHHCYNDGIITAASPLTQQLPKLQHLRELSIKKIMDDQSLLELAKAARSGHLRKLNVLDLSLNEELSDLGWRDFFLTLDDMSELRDLNISRLYTNQLKPQADTFKAFVQCVSRLPALVTIRMLSWMLDDMDFNLFNSMKESHPQSRRLFLWWQWALPFTPIIQADE